MKNKKTRKPAWEDALSQFLANWKKRPDVIGALVSGSRVLGTDMRNSDIDVHIVLSGEVAFRYRWLEIPFEDKRIGDGMEQQEMVERLNKIEATLSEIVERNRRVEVEKAWETSTTRILSVVVLTYALMSLTFAIIGVQGCFINAIIPTLGYFLSTQSLPLIKRWWMKGRREGRDSSAHA